MREKHRKERAGSRKKLYPSANNYVYITDNGSE